MIYKNHSWSCSCQQNLYNKAGVNCSLWVKQGSPRAWTELEQLVLSNAHCQRGWAPLVQICQLKIVTAMQRGTKMEGSSTCAEKQHVYWNSESTYSVEEAEDPTMLPGKLPLTAPFNVNAGWCVIQGLCYIKNKAKGLEEVCIVTRLFALLTKWKTAASIETLWAQVTWADCHIILDETFSHRRA